LSPRIAFSRFREWVDRQAILSPPGFRLGALASAMFLDDVAPPLPALLTIAENAAAHRWMLRTGAGRKAPKQKLFSRDIVPKQAPR
jgi:hypothetical protein